MVVVASHRGPVRFSIADGEVQPARGSGGLVTAFAGLGSWLPEAVWICAASDETDAAVARAHAVASTGSPVAAFAGPDTSGWWLRMLEIEPTTHHQFYGMIANPLLWFVQHRLWDLSDAPDISPAEHAAWTDGYVAVNRLFADAIIDQLAGVDEPRVLVQDYHLYLVPAMVRAAVPSAFVSFFCHIPWPALDAWRVIPVAWRRAIFEGVLGADVVGFQTEANARNFATGCVDLLGVEADERRLELRYQGRPVSARWYPISVDADELRALAASPAALVHGEEISATRREKLIVRVDRADPSKNILRGFRAYDLLLRRHEELRRRVTFLGLLQRTREDVTEYSVYMDRIVRTVAEVNLKHGTPDWQPIDLRFIDDRSLAVAAYAQYDVLVVNAIADGMNLVAKEGVIVNQRDGVLLLSDATGAHAELGGFAVSIDPFDIDQQAQAMWHALRMPAAERASRRRACAEIVERNDLRRWLRVQLEDSGGAGERTRTSTPEGTGT